jgi:hypothetical protein
VTTRQTSDISPVPNVRSPRFSHIAVIRALGHAPTEISHASNRSPCAAAAQPDDGAPQVLTDPTARPPRRGRRTSPRAPVRPSRYEQASRLDAPSPRQVPGLVGLALVAGPPAQGLPRRHDRRRRRERRALSGICLVSSPSAARASVLPMQILAIRGRGPRGHRRLDGSSGKTGGKGASFRC